jgi:ribosomal protein S24E
MNAEIIKMEESPKAKKKDVVKLFPSDRVILDTIYSHYGKPKNIVKEKVYSQELKITQTTSLKGLR